MAIIPNSVPLTGPIAPIDDTDTYPTWLARYGKGGYRSVDNLAALAAIPDLHLEEGMLVKAIEDDTYYSYKNGEWVLESFAAGDAGADGLSAYQVAVLNGFVGDEQAWLASLRGDDGADGAGRTLDYAVKSSDFTAQSFFVYGVDTTDNAVTATLGVKTNSDVVYFADATVNAVTHNPLTILGSGCTIAGSASLILTNNAECVGLIYDAANNNWVIFGTESSGVAGGGNGSGGGGGGGIDTDEKVKVSATDTTADYLINKINAGTNITISKTSSDDESLVISGTVVEQGNNILVEQTGNTYTISTHAANLIYNSTSSVSLNSSGGPLAINIGGVNSGEISSTALAFPNVGLTVNPTSIYHASTGFTVQHNRISFTATYNDPSLQKPFNIGVFSNQDPDEMDVGIGPDAMKNKNGVGGGNTAIGNNCLRNFVEGISNTAVGCSAMLNAVSNGYDSGLDEVHANTSIGHSSLRSLIDGSENVAVGINAGSDLVTGAANTFIGSSWSTFGVRLTNGSNNTLIGAYAQPSVATVNNEITLGSTSITSLRCAVTSITALSDRRDKTDIQTLPIGLDFICNLNPVKFIWNTRDGAKVGQQAVGFIAQDLQEAQQGHEYLNLVLDNNPDKLEATPGNLIPVLVKAIQDLNHKVSMLEQQLGV